MTRLLKNLFPQRSSQSRVRGAARKRSYTPRLEALEERQVPTTFSVWNAADSGVGTLRQAILDSNAYPSQSGVNVIDFEFAPGTFHFINLASSLPVITAAVDINGYSQLGSHDNTLAKGDDSVMLIGLYGEGAWTGLYVNASNVSVRGLGISHFKGDGIWVFGGANNTVIQGNYIGQNGGDGIRLYSSNNVIGSDIDPGHRNIISDNGGFGVEINSSPGYTPKGNYIGDNWIGIDAPGHAAGNAKGGIKLNGAFDTQIGGNANALNGNVIAFNGGSGILMTGAGTSFTFVGGNNIHDNFGEGVDIFYGAHDNFVGGQPGWSNAIHNNAFDGVLLREGTENYVTKNSFFANSEAVTLMQGANQGIQAPWLTSAVGGSTTVTITGHFHGKANTTYEIDFYRNPDKVYYRDEGMYYLGAIGVTTNAQGNATFVTKLSKTVNPGETVTAQLGGSEGYSEFSLPVSFVKMFAPPGGPAPALNAGQQPTDAYFKTLQSSGAGTSYLTLDGGALKQAVAALNTLGFKHSSSKALDAMWSAFDA
jgi:parallel beta-helix repeat protein